jgi:hypothetical protein
MSDPIDVAASNWDVMIAEEREGLRTCTPVHVTVFTPLAAATVEGQTAIPDRLPNGRSGKVSDLLVDRPVWYPGGGGFYLRYPLVKGDIALGMVSDRSLAGWSLTRTPGPTSAPTFPHYHHISDTQILPVTDQPGIPEDDPGLGTDMVIGGPAGVAIRIGQDGAVTITTPTATIEMDVGGAITLTPLAGQTVKLGGSDATLGVARLTDPVGPTVAMGAWASMIEAAITGVGGVILPGTNFAATVLNSFATITGASTTSLSK